MPYEKAATQAGNANNAYYQSDLSGNGTGPCIVGHSTSFGNISSAVRFPSIPLPQGTSVIGARLHFWIDSVGGGTARFNTYGIKETNTADFSVSSPFGRSPTTAFYSDSKNNPSTGQWTDTDVKDAVNEILGQSGWVSGNAMGFLIENNGSDLSNGWFEDTYHQKEVLTIQLSSTPNLFPTPIVISPPTFPSTDDYGIRVSEPGVDVHNATDSQLFFTTRKKLLRVNQEVQLADTISSYAHGLSYAPCVLGYYTDSSSRKRIMNQPSNIFSQEAYIAADATNVYLGSDGSGNPTYVYIFIDPLA